MYGHADYARLAGISVTHLYHLRKGTGYRRRHWTQTASVRIAIGERRKPDPDGQPGYLRIDGPPGRPGWPQGVYPINA